VEDAIKSTLPSVQAVIAISVPHRVMQEEVGIVMTTKAGFPRPSLADVQHAVSEVTVILLPNTMHLVHMYHIFTYCAVATL
jgi:acyl-CoA synthetase (AMP-forming)/AMP-acid ligase II